MMQRRRLRCAMTRRALLQGSAGFAFASGFLNQKGAASGQRPNILWIIADDLSPDLGCYGNTLVHSPNIDRLANEGVRYTNAFVTAPVCSPSRSALITGMYQTTIGAHHHRSRREDGYTLPPPVRLITDFFREEGYYTVNNEDTGLGSSGKTDFNFHVEKPFDGSDWNTRDSRQPFYAQVNIFQPHRARPPDVWSATNNLERHVDPGKVRLPPYYPDHPIARKDWAGYLDCIAVLDKKVGRVLTRLDKEGLTENTVVVFFGDHGRPQPRAKQFLYDAGIRVPLIIRWPRHLDPGSVSDELISAIDISATSLYLAGVKPPDYMQGQVFLGPNIHKRKYIFSARDRCDETVDRIRCVRDQRYKYIRNFYSQRPYMQSNLYKEASYPTWRLLKRMKQKGTLSPEQALFAADDRPEEELYDLQSDPYELDNLAGSSDRQDVLGRMRHELQKWIEETDDKGENREDPAIAASWEKRMRTNYADLLDRVYALDDEEMGELREGDNE